MTTEIPTPTGDLEAELQAVAVRVAAQWDARDPADSQSAHLRGLSAGTITDWGLAGEGLKSKQPPISMSGGIPDAATQPKAGLLRAMERALAVPDDSPLVYGGPLGYEPLRTEIGKYFARDHAEIPGADHFMLTNGAAGAIDMAASLLLDRGDVVISEMPTFAGSLRTFRGHGVDVVGVHLDEEGIRLDQVEAQIARLRAEGRTPRLIYTIPTFHNPTGITTSLQRRIDLVDLAAREGIYILEDTAYSELFFTPERPPTISSVAGGRGVLTAGTFSKVIATGLRIGWLQAEPALIDLMLPARFDMGNSPLLHRMLHEFMVGGEFAPHVEQMRRVYSDKVDALTETLRDAGEPYFDFTKPEGGFFLWLRLREGLNCRDVQQAGFEEGAIFAPGVVFYPGGDPDGDQDALRLAYSWTRIDDLVAGAERVLAACARVSGK
ncbi:MAG: 2-aminoadipate transaminase [Chloroflexi bacterium]|nr:MAG: 2-aminoadipate transaminase [Chloroflexota bacterium]